MCLSSRRPLCILEPCLGSASFSTVSSGGNILLERWVSAGCHVCDLSTFCIGQDVMFTDRGKLLGISPCDLKSQGPCSWLTLTWWLPSSHRLLLCSVSRFPSPPCWPCSACGSASPCLWSTWVITSASVSSPMITRCAPTRSPDRSQSSAGTWTSS